MKPSRGIAAGTLSRSVETGLSGRVRLGIGGRLFAAVVGMGLLGMAWIHGRLVPDQPSITTLMMAMAAVVVSAPIVATAVRGFVARPPHAYPEQLVSLALLAAMARGDFFTATLVPFLMDLAHFLEERCVAGTRAAIDKVRALHAREATVMREGVEVRVPAGALEVGDTVVIRPGETIPGDGVVRQGFSSVDAAPVTGESGYDEVAPGQRVFAGTVNLSGLLEVEVTRVGDATALGRVVALLGEAESSRAPVTRLLERFAGYYLPLVILLAALVFFLTGALDRAITVLVVACPCAFVLSSPTAMVAALAVASRLNILIKNTRFLEAAAEVDTLVLDKTGTVTLGRLEVSAVEVATGSSMSETELLATAAVAGRGSLHPASRAVVEACRARESEPAPVPVPAEPAPRLISTREEPGRGTVAETDRGVVRLGRWDWLRELGVVAGRPPEEIESRVWLAQDRTLLGSFQLADRPRPEAARALRACRALGAERLILLTGDREAVASRVAAELGFDDHVAGVLPEQKLDVVRREQAAGRRVMVVGDGGERCAGLGRSGCGGGGGGHDQRGGAGECGRGDPGQRPGTRAGHGGSFHPDPPHHLYQHPGRNRVQRGHAGAGRSGRHRRLGRCRTPQRRRPVRGGQQRPVAPVRSMTVMVFPAEQSIRGINPGRIRLPGFSRNTRATGGPGGMLAAVRWRRLILTPWR